MILCSMNIEISASAVQCTSYVVNITFYVFKVTVILYLLDK